MRTENAIGYTVLALVAPVSAVAYCFLDSSFGGTAARAGVVLLVMIALAGLGSFAAVAGMIHSARWRKTACSDAESTLIALNALALLINAHLGVFSFFAWCLRDFPAKLG